MDGFHLDYTPFSRWEHLEVLRIELTRDLPEYFLLDLQPAIYVDLRNPKLRTIRLSTSGKRTIFQRKEEMWVQV